MNTRLDTPAKRAAALVDADKFSRADGIFKAWVEGTMTEEEAIVAIKALALPIDSQRLPKSNTAVPNDPYLQPNGTLKNKLGIADAHELEIRKTALVTLRTCYLVEVDASQKQVKSKYDASSIGPLRL